MARNILLGFEVGSGAEVRIPLHHMIVTGTTQMSGKTTTLQALISRSERTAIAFRTKRGEADFSEAHQHAPYFRERADWQYVQSILEATMRERLKFERSWIIRATKNADTLREVRDNVINELRTARGISEGVYTNLKAYLDIVIPQIEKIRFADKVWLQPGLNVMDLEGMTEEVQALVIASTLESIHQNAKGVISIVPEAWKFVPQGRKAPVQVVIEKLAREGAVLGNYVWLDSQDITGVDKPTLKNFDIWLLGRQREVNEVKRAISQIPLPKKAKPAPEDVAQLPLGHFVACYGDSVKIVYVQPAWLAAELARDVAMGTMDVTTIADCQPEPKLLIIEDEGKNSPFQDDVEALRKQQPERPKTMSFDEQLAAAHREADALRAEIKSAMKKLGGIVDDKWDDEVLITQFRETISATVNAGRQTAPATGNGKVQAGPMHIDAIEREVSITFSQEERTFKTTGPKGMIMFALVHDLKNDPSGESEISAAMVERGWTYPHNTLAPELAKLARDGDLIKEGATRGVRYRVPGKLRLTIDGKKITP
jgi:hypothetical protein